MNENKKCDSINEEILESNYDNSIYYLQVGEGDVAIRCWEDFKEYGFMSGGQDYKKYGRKMEIFKIGDIVLAYLSGHGYVGVGIVEAKSIPVSEFQYKNKLLSSYPLKNKNVCVVSGDLQDAEFAIQVKWIKALDRDQAIENKTDTFRSFAMIAALDNQKQTLMYLEKQFAVNFEDLFKKI